MRAELAEARAALEALRSQRKGTPSPVTHSAPAPPPAQPADLDAAIQRALAAHVAADSKQARARAAASRPDDVASTDVDVDGDDEHPSAREGRAAPRRKRRRRGLPTKAGADATPTQAGSDAGVRTAVALPDMIPVELHAAFLTWLGAAGSIKTPSSARTGKRAR